MRTALEIAAAGEMADIAKPMKGIEAGIHEVRVAYKSDAYRAIYTVRLGTDIWVVHAFQKKSTQGIKTPKREIDLIQSHLKQLRKMYG